MILSRLYKELYEKDITRTCGDDPAVHDGLIGTYGILPAHAGMILIQATCIVTRNDITRTCGDDPEIFEDGTLNGVYYPHMRG